jgi:ubiquinone/menaquinone biosynthesis C-methylase UbiE
MRPEEQIARHYSHRGLTKAIERGVKQLGKTTQTVTIADLAPVDEFHVGGRLATIEFMDQLSFADTDHVLDVGCGIGGACRFVADRYGVHVSGIDLTAEFIETGRDICAWLEVGDRVSLHQGSALDMPFEAGKFNHAYMMHVGMNIRDKKALFAEVARVVKVGGSFGIFDVMQTSDDELGFPVPWATTDETSALDTQDAYTEALNQAGFTITGVRNRKDFALAFFNKLRANATLGDQPPPLGLHILMGESAPIKFKNMFENISRGCISPVEILAKKG